jgi:hypothetical protein
MRLNRIHVDSEVFAALWRQRRPGEDSENDILRRLYGLSGDIGDVGGPAGAVTAVPAANAPVVNPPSLEGALGQRASDEKPLVRSPGIIHREGATPFEDGFAIFRSFQGREYHAEAVKGGWRLAGDGRIHASLEALNQAIGVAFENAWMGWSYRNAANKRRPLDDYRLQKR